MWKNLKARIAAIVENLNKSVYEINYLNGKITEIVTITNQVLQTYGDAPMVKITNIEAEIKNVRETTQRTAGIVSSLVDNIHETIEDGVSDMKDDVSTVKEIVEKTLVDEWASDWENNSVYYKLNDALRNVSSLEDVVEEVKNAVGNIERNISNSISSLESKIEDVKSTVGSVEYNVRDIKDTVGNIGNTY